MPKYASLFGKSTWAHMSPFPLSNMVALAEVPSQLAPRPASSLADLEVRLVREILSLPLFPFPKVSSPNFSLIHRIEVRFSLSLKTEVCFFPIDSSRLELDLQSNAYKVSLVVPLPLCPKSRAFVQKAPLPCSSRQPPDSLCCRCAPLPLKGR